MRIVHFVESLDPAKGGPVRSSTALAYAQARLDHEVYIVTCRDEDADAHWRGVESGLPESGVLRRILVPRPSWWHLFGYSSLHNFGELLGPETVVHVHGLWRPFCARAVRSGLRAGSVIALSPRGMVDTWSLDQKKLKKRLALDLVWRRLLDSCSLLHALNQEEADSIVALGLRPPVRVVPNGVFPEQFIAEKSGTAFRASMPELGNAPYILFLGRLHYKKGCDYLIDAFRLLTQATPTPVFLVIAGPDEGAERDLRHAVASYGLANRVLFPGALYGKLKWSALAGTCCFCLPSRQEGFSVGILEALASGAPAVVSRQCNFPALAVAGAGLVVELTAKAVAEALATYVDSDDAFERSRRAARNLVFTDYDWRVLAERTVEAYAATPEQ